MSAKRGRTAAVADSDEEEEKVVKGRRKINIEFIEDKSRRHITFSKRKAGIMKKAYELSTLTGTQVLLLVASETGHVYTYATPKLQPLITKPEGKDLIQSCLNEPDSPTQDQSGPTEEYYDSGNGALSSLVAYQAASGDAAGILAGAGGGHFNPHPFQYSMHFQQQQAAQAQQQQQQHQQSYQMAARQQQYAAAAAAAALQQQHAQAQAHQAHQAHQAQAHAHAQAQAYAAARSEGNDDKGDA